MTTHAAESPPVFLDSNVILYSLGDEDAKGNISIALLQNRPWISTQVVNECSHVLRRKIGWPPTRVARTLTDILSLVRLIEIGIEDTRTAWKLAAR